MVGACGRAGPNGAGKTTFARRYLPEHGVIHFVNADLIASGLSPLRPDLAAIAAARMLLRELDRLAVPRVDVVRRFSRSWGNFRDVYRALADSWAVYDNSGDEPRLLEKS
jgi:predicted ABC-type ATPase